MTLPCRDSVYTPWRYSMATYVKLVGVLATMLAVFIYLKDRPRRLGRSQADADWAARSAVVYIDHTDMYAVEGPYSFIRWYDTRTGLKLRPWRSESFGRAYNQRIDEIIREQGIPSWSAKPAIPDDAELIAMLQASMQAVAVFPHEITANVALQADFQGECRSVSVVGRSERYGNLTLALPNPDKGVFVARDRIRPETVYIRSGRKWISAFTGDGRHLVDLCWTLDGNEDESTKYGMDAHAGVYHEGGTSPQAEPPSLHQNEP